MSDSEDYKQDLLDKAASLMPTDEAGRRGWNLALKAAEICISCSPYMNGPDQCEAEKILDSLRSDV